MASVQDVLRIAAADIGYIAKNDPEAGSKYGRWMAGVTGENWLRGASWLVPYCAMAVSKWLSDAGLKWSVTPSYNCDQIRTRARAAGYIIPNKYAAQAGDLVLYDWNHNGSCDHIGIVEKNCGSYLQTIEGNTSSGNAGSQSNGGGVWRRTRAWGSVACIIRPPYDGVSKPTQPTPTPKVQLIAVDGWIGHDTWKAYQKISKSPYIDGIISRQPIGNKKYWPCAGNAFEWVQNPNEGSQSMATLQKLVGTDPDGWGGYNTVCALQRFLGVTVDGIAGRETALAFQRWINKQLQGM